MESGAAYKEFDTKAKSPKLFALVFTVLAIVLCTLIGVGTWVMLSNGEAPVPVKETRNIFEEVVIVETPRHAAQVKIEKPAEIDFKEGMSSDSVDNAILEEVQETIKQEGKALPANEDIAVNDGVVSDHDNFLRSLMELSNNVMSEIFNKITESRPFGEMFDSSVEQGGEGAHSRRRRSIVSAAGANAIKYLSYLSFGRFMFNEVVSITEYAVEGRKLSGDSDAFFLDNGFWATPAKKASKKQKAEEKVDATVAEMEASPNSVASSPIRLPSAFDNGWTPMVNQVSLSFITEMLTTLLNLMREYLMKDNVMECLWFMFCKDMNHQAEYQDPMGYLARVNSVGLKVLVDREGRERDTISSVWQALFEWQPLECEAMFPKCDASRALEIVNEVASAAR